MPKNTPNILRKYHEIYKTHEFEKKEKFINTCTTNSREILALFKKKTLLL